MLRIKGEEDADTVLYLKRDNLGDICLCADIYTLMTFQQDGKVYVYDSLPSRLNIDLDNDVVLN